MPMAVPVCLSAAKGEAAGLEELELGEGAGEEGEEGECEEEEAGWGGEGVEWLHSGVGRSARVRVTPWALWAL